MGISVVLPHREACMAGWSEDAQATTDVGTITDTKAANIRPHDGTTTADLIATGPSGSGAFAAGSATLNFTDVDTGAAHKWFGFAVGAAGSGTGQGVSTAELDHETSASQMIKNIVVT
jgi:hypothetical protein